MRIIQVQSQISEEGKDNSINGSRTIVIRKNQTIHLLNITEQNKSQMN